MRGRIRGQYPISEWELQRHAKFASVGLESALRLLVVSTAPIIKKLVDRFLEEYRVPEPDSVKTVDFVAIIECVAVGLRFKKG
jgi:hypothetical protein